MEILLTLSGFIFACLVALLYEYKIKQIRKEPRNKVHFYVTKYGNTSVLWFGKPQYNGDGFESNQINIEIIAYKSDFKHFGLNFKDFTDLKDDEIREVFINLEN